LPAFDSRAIKATKYKYFINCIACKCPFKKIDWLVEAR